jgi:protein tyrosine phosphatase type 4A
MPGPGTASLTYKPTLLEVKPMRFVIMDAPRQSNLHLYIKELNALKVKNVVRVCEPTYHADALLNAGITCHDMEYPDGHSPPPEIIEQWLQLVESTFYSSNHSNNTTNSSSKSYKKRNSMKEKQGMDGVDQAAAAVVGVEDSKDDGEQVALAVHCVAGLGRAPVLVAIALIEFAHMDAVEAVTLIRRHRKGSINEKQLLYLEGYKRRYKRKLDGGGLEKGSNCIVM